MRDWWKTQITFLVKELRVKILHYLEKELTKEQLQTIMKMEEEQIGKIMREIDTRQRYKEGL